MVFSFGDLMILLEIELITHQVSKFGICMEVSVSLRLMFVHVKWMLVILVISNLVLVLVVCCCYWGDMIIRLFWEENE